VPSATPALSEDQAARPSRPVHAIPVPDRSLTSLGVVLRSHWRRRSAERRLFTEHNAALVLFGAASVGLAFGLARSPTRGGRLAALVAATAAGTVFYQLGRSQLGRSS